MAAPRWSRIRSGPARGQFLGRLVLVGAQFADQRDHAGVDARHQPIDDWAMAPLSEPERRDFWEICEDRYQVRSTILTSQLYCFQPGVNHFLPVGLG